jgi:iron complex transport system ATP-binding protein
MLDVRGLRLAYGDRAVLKDVGLAVAEGEVVGLVGPNGCGKSSLLKAITGVVERQAGEVKVDGVDIRAASARDLARKVAVVPQSPTLPLGYTAREVVVMGRTPYLGFFDQESASDYRLADDALALVGSQHLASRPVDELSGGERQNVVIARALVQKTRLLLLDEPTANLDIGHQISIARLLKRLAAEQGVAVVAALHDLTLAALHCDRIVLLAGGVVVADGEPTSVFTADNLQLAYGTRAVVLKPEALPGPIVLPLEGRFPEED